MPAQTFARGVAKILTVGGVETTFGTPATGTGQQLRRTSSTLALNVTPIESNEIIPSQQVRDSRHGPFQVSGSIAGQLSPATYKLLFENLLRSTFTAGYSVTGMTDNALAITDATVDTATITGTGEHFLTGNSGNAFKIGDMVRIAGLTGAPGTADNGQNWRITSLTDTVMGVAASPSTNSRVAFTTPGQTDSISVVGKKLFIPASGGTAKSLTFEHWYSDVGVSEVFTGCVISQIALNIPASGFVNFQASLTGQSMILGSAANYATPTAPTSTLGLTAVGGLLSYKGAPVAYISSINVNIAAQLQADPMVGSNAVPFIFQGILRASGSLTCLMVNDSMMADFLNEVELDIGILLSTSPTGNADFVSIYMPRVKISANTKSDSDRAIVRSLNFTALEQAGGGPALVWDDTTITVQDSLA